MNTALQPPGSPCPVIHFEMPYHDAGRAMRFYQQAFGWRLQALGPQMGDYQSFVDTEGNRHSLLQAQPAGDCPAQE